MNQWRRISGLKRKKFFFYKSDCADPTSSTWDTLFFSLIIKSCEKRGILSFILQISSQVVWTVLLRYSKSPTYAKYLRKQPYWSYLIISSLYFHERVYRGVSYLSSNPVTMFNIEYTGIRILNNKVLGKPEIWL